MAHAAMAPPWALQLLLGLLMVAYRVAASVSTATGTSSLNFLFHGDWGWAGLNQTLVGYQMGNWSVDHDAKFLIALGDNYYHDGVWNDTDPLWDRFYRSVYVSSGLQIPWYVVLGNHDYIRNPQAQIDYTLHHRDDRWFMPSHLFNAVYPLPNSTETVEVVFIDSTRLSVTESPHTMPGGKNEVTPFQKEKYLKRLERMLRASTARWLLVAGHYTVYSQADHGDNTELIACLAPLMRRFRVQAYLNGHDHVLQHMSKQGIEYVTSGRGALSDGWPPLGWDTNAHTSQAALRFVSASPGFGAARASEEMLQLSFHSQHGDELYATVLTNPRTPEDRQQIEQSEEGWENMPVTMVACVLLGLMFGSVLGHCVAQKDSHDAFARLQRSVCGGSAAQDAGPGGPNDDARVVTRSPLRSSSQHGLLEEGKATHGGRDAPSAEDDAIEIELSVRGPGAPRYVSVVNMADDEEALDL